ncbi:hypothetical protein V6N13_095993 [Hibiscus sabdariffa]|uniref:Uncharacterized protein n=1 Tax=Hibiscus sabdariffa TaxID=183260 RepID=A0ABR2DH12_9ROSI
MLNNPEALRDVGVVDDLEDEFEDASFFLELTNCRCKKKCASFFYLQDEVLSVKEKRKIDQAIKKSRKLGKESTSLDISRHSSSDSDIVGIQRLKQLTKKVLELSKKNWVPIYRR